MGICISKYEERGVGKDDFATAPLYLESVASATTSATSATEGTRAATATSSAGAAGLWAVSFGLSDELSLRVVDLGF